MRLVDDGVRHFFEIVVRRIAEEEALHDGRDDEHELQSRVFDERDEFFLTKEKQLLKEQTNVGPAHPSTFFFVKRYAMHMKSAA